MQASVKQLLVLPGMKTAVAGRILARLAAPMIQLALVLYLTPTFGVAFAGVAFALYSIFQAIGHVKLSTLLDSHGQTPVILPASLVSGAMLLAVPVFAHYDIRVGVLVACSVAGLAAPPVATGIRTIWEKVASKELTTASVAFESLLTEMLYVIGPLVVTICIALYEPVAALWTASALVLTGGTLYCLSSAVRQSTAAHNYKPLVMRRERKLWAPIVAMAFWCFNYGGAAVAIPFHWQELGQDSNTGLVFAAISVGALTGGWLYGVRAATNFTTTKFSMVIIAYGLMYTSFALVGSSLTAALLIGFAAGSVNAITFTGMYVWVANCAPAHGRTAAYGWSFSAMGMGIGTGSLCAGFLLDGLGYEITLMLVFIPCLISGIISLLSPNHKGIDVSAEAVA